MIDSFWFQVSSFKFQVSSFKFQVSSLKLRFEPAHDDFIEIERDSAIEMMKILLDKE